MIIAISASFVTCCMSINTADFLCQCIVHVLGIMLLFFWISCPDWQVCVQNRRLCPPPNLGRLLYSLWKNEQEDEEGKKEKIQDYFGGLVLDCSYYSIWCAICDRWMFLVYLCSDKIMSSNPRRPPLTETKCSNNAIDLVLILFNFISINTCCLPPTTDSLLLFLISFHWDVS